MADEAEQDPIIKELREEIEKTREHNTEMTQNLTRQNIGIGLPSDLLVQSLIDTLYGPDNEYIRVKFELAVEKRVENLLLSAFTPEMQVEIRKAQIAQGVEESIQQGMNGQGKVSGGGIVLPGSFGGE